jgi:virginiamycin B lyase
MTSQLCLFLVSIFAFPIFHNVAFGQSDNTPLIKEFPVPQGSHPHDVAPAKNGSVWYTAQRLGQLGKLDPISGRSHHIGLGQGSAPHGVIVGPDEAPWITDGGLNAIVRVDPTTKNVTVFRLPEKNGNATLNTATFDHKGILWFTGQGGIYGRLDPNTGNMEVFEAPKGQGPYGICTTPDGQVYFVSLAGSYLAQIDLDTGNATVINPPTVDQGARRVWSDSTNRLWISEWNTGTWVCMTLLPRNGKNGNCQVKTHNQMQYLLMIKIWFGSVILVLIPFYDSTRQWKNFNRFHSLALMLKYANC